MISASACSESELESERKAVDSLRLSTANGVCKTNRICDAKVPALNEEAEVRILDKTPRVSSACKLVEAGASFWWTPEEGAILKYRGQVHKLEVQRGVPLLAAPAFEVFK